MEIKRIASTIGTLAIVGAASVAGSALWTRVRQEKSACRQLFKLSENRRKPKQLKTRRSPEQGLFLFAELASAFMKKEVAVMSPGRMSQHLRWCHIRTKTEQLSGRK